MTGEIKDLKSSKNSVIAALAALSKAANDAALATAGFFQSVDANVDTSKDIKDLATTLSILGASVRSIDEQIPLLSADLNGKKLLPARKKVERDPNAPKKPLTAFFAYSATVRDKIRLERAAKGEPSLSSVELTQIISQQWNELTDEQKEDWKKKYYVELVGYNERFEKYKTDKAQGSSSPTTLDDKKTNGKVAPVESEKKSETHESSSEKKKSKKRKAEDVLVKKEDRSDEKKKEKKKDKKKKKSSE